MAKFDFLGLGGFAVPSKIIISLVLSLGVAACSTSEQPETYPKVTFSHLNTLNVDAARLDIKLLYKAPLRTPNVEHLSPLSFENAVNTWASQRFETNLSSGNSIAILIKEGSITEKTLPISTGLSGAIKKEQQFEYESVLDVEVQIIGPDSSVRGDVTSRVWQRRTIEEGASDYEKRLLWLELVEAAVNELDTQLERRFRQDLSAYIRF